MQSQSQNTSERILQMGTCFTSMDDYQWSHIVDEGTDLNIKKSSWSLVARKKREAGYKKIGWRG